jgi:CNT family concentrative nucleoside transporter
LVGPRRAGKRIGGGAASVIGLVGLVALYGVALLMSRNRRAVSPRLIAWGLGLQLIFALVILKTPWGRAMFEALAAGVEALLVFADQGSLFVFGEAADPAGDLGYVFAFRVLPIVIFISSLFSVFYYLGVMQRIVLLMAKAMHRLMGVSGSWGRPRRRSSSRPTFRR